MLLAEGVVMLHRMLGILKEELEKHKLSLKHNMAEVLVTCPIDQPEMSSLKDSKSADPVYPGHNGGSEMSRPINMQPIFVIRDTSL